MPTADEHLKADVGAHLAHLMFQIAMLKAELDRLREDAHRAACVAAPDGGAT